MKRSAIILSQHYYHIYQVFFWHKRKSFIWNAT